MCAVNHALAYRLYKSLYIVFLTSQTDGRVDSVEKKIAKLDEELLKYKQQMAKMKDGAGKVYM